MIVIIVSSGWKMVFKPLLIHDPKADKAAAAMDVGVGHLSDPVSTHFFDPFCFRHGLITFPGF